MARGWGAGSGRTARGVEFGATPIPAPPPPPSLLLFRAPQVQQLEQMLRD
eukprot:COSAG01_NODE_66810_length_269_cov_0.541176_1_plen_49_part_01